jgi:hypothetical protein
MHLRFTRTSVVLLAILAACGPVSADDPKDQMVVKKFVNSREGLTGERAARYVDFSFEYPEGWRVKREIGNRDRNFVTVERIDKNEYGTFTQEQFNVGLFHLKGKANSAMIDPRPDPAKKKLRDESIAQLKKQLTPGFPAIAFTREGLTTLGDLSGYEVRFTGAYPQKVKGQEFKYWGRMILIPNPDGSENGLMLFMLGTVAAPELKAEKDLGVNGELPVILNSFKVGKPKKP